MHGVVPTSCTASSCNESNLANRMGCVDGRQLGSTSSQPGQGDTTPQGRHPLSTGVPQPRSLWKTAFGENVGSRENRLLIDAALGGLSYGETLGTAAGLAVVVIGIFAD